LTIVASGGYAEVVTADAALVAALGDAGFEVSCPAAAEDILRPGRDLR
jgi:hypothetical protein